MKRASLRAVCILLLVLVCLYYFPLFQAPAISPDIDSCPEDNHHITSDVFTTVESVVNLSSPYGIEPSFSVGGEVENINHIRGWILSDKANFHLIKSHFSTLLPDYTKKTQVLK